MSWHNRRLAGLDIETTGLDLDNDRVVAVAISVVGGEQPSTHHYWLVDPGIEIPVVATGIHGITTEQAKAKGCQPRAAVKEVTAILAELSRQGTPIAAFNARFDFTILDRETDRCGVTGLTRFAGKSGVCVLDPYVLDKKFDRYRAGKRTLAAVCNRYCVPFDASRVTNAHAIAAATLASRIVCEIPVLYESDPATLHREQVTWAAEQATSLEAHFRQAGCDDHVERAWPVVPSVNSITRISHGRSARARRRPRSRGPAEPARSATVPRVRLKPRDGSERATRSEKADKGAYRNS